MLIEIFDVDHGFCALITADNGSRVLLDCGHSALTGLRPSMLLPARGIESLDALIVSHADEDHLSDLPSLMGKVFVRSVIANDSLNMNVLRRIKPGAGLGVQAFIRRGLLVELVGDDKTYPTLPLAKLIFYRNRYPLFEDLNNLSLVTFLHYGDIHAIFPGDIEVAGWRSLLRDPGFCAQLASVNLFVASHHGRENGFCQEVFRFCKPELVVISDNAVRYASQEMTQRYADQAVGVHFGLRRRKVLTTRCDGTIRIWQSLQDNIGAWAIIDRTI
jgi:beta-lactamase superfamily II metal-dependent hydrolase